MQKDWALGAIHGAWVSVSQTTNIRITEDSLLKTQLLGLMPDLPGPVPWNLPFKSLLRGSYALQRGIVGGFATTGRS